MQQIQLDHIRAAEYRDSKRNCESTKKSNSDFSKKLKENVKKHESGKNEKETEIKDKVSDDKTEVVSKDNGAENAEAVVLFMQNMQRTPVEAKPVTSVKNQVKKPGAEVVIDSLDSHSDAEGSIKLVTGQENANNSAGIEEQNILNEGTERVSKSNKTVSSVESDGESERTVFENTLVETADVPVTGKKVFNSEAKIVSEPGGKTTFERAQINDAAGKISSGIEAGKTEFEIEMEPANLGKLSIKVTCDEGKTIIAINCTEKNFNIIAGNSEQIASILENNTAEDTVVMVDHKEADYLNQEKDNQQGDRQQEEQQRNQSEHEERSGERFLEALRLGIA